MSDINGGEIWSEILSEISSEIKETRNFRKIGGFTGKEAYIEVPPTGYSYIVCKDGSRTKTEYYPIEVCEGFVKKGSWEELEPNEGVQYSERDLIQRAINQASSHHTYMVAMDRAVNKFRWEIVKKLFACGSTQAEAICWKYGYDPDKMVGK